MVYSMSKVVLYSSGWLKMKNIFYNTSYIYIYIYILKIAELDCCQIIILSIYVPSTHAYTHVLRLSLDLPYETR